MKKKSLKANSIQSVKSKHRNKKKEKECNDLNLLNIFKGNNPQNFENSNAYLEKNGHCSTLNPVSLFQHKPNYNSSSVTNSKVNSSNYSKMVSTDYVKFPCIYCNISFPNKMKLQEHCLTDEHQSIIISDEGRDWNYRPPPRGVLANEYSLCINFIEKLVCRLGDQCVQAHSKEELAEWKERFEYRSMKLEKAKERELHGASYADRLLEKLNNSQNIDMLLSEKVDGVAFSVSSDLNLCISQKPSSHTWVITLHCRYRIHAAALLYDSHRNHFSLTNITMINSLKHIHKSFKLKDSQEWINNDLDLAENVNMEYKIEIHFQTEIYGTFRQAIVIDFGIEPVFIKKFCVDIVPLTEFKELETARTTVITHSERWCHENTDIVSFEPVEKTAYDIFNDKLLEMYPPPTNKNISLSQSSLEKYPTKNNYRTRMHDLLNYEEMAQFDLISQFNIQSYVQLSKSYMIMPYTVSVANYAMAGELYAKLDLSSEVSEDSPQGRLILNNCNSILVAKPDETNLKTKNHDRRAYEALLEAKTKKEIYIRLSRQTVLELNLQADVDVPLDIQFQLNRLPFCEMHYAIDHLVTFEFLFPNVINEPTIPWSPTTQWNEVSEMKLNIKQKEALVAITTKIDIILPPVLIIGPFGTGKTFTMSRAILQIIQQPITRILICTHSNSAADIYIRDYLHPQYEGGILKEKPLRVYYHRRRVATVHSTIHQYCLFENKNGEQVFCLPTKEQIYNHRIIVTTINTSFGLAQIGIPKGFFTHILIDEAAQVMECSTLIPLSLANQSTRIVLAGDYMQLSTEVFSTVCKERNLQTSLLERLYDHYPSGYPCKIMLVENYRSHPAIIKFTSRFFYEGRLKPRGKVSAHPRHNPLTFFTARGEDIQDSNSTAFYNNSEVLEVCERVIEICKSWPVKLWGPLDEESIGVLSPYLDQVMRIRAELRKKKLYKVSVERVLNVQGKEFRVVILSTVRTRHTCSGNDSSLDFGFLSNAKLLTTAITRAQSLIAVVGDPVSLCSVGQCRKLWEEFLRQCSEAGSLHGITWANLRSQLDGIELKKIYGLNPLAQEFIPRYLLFSAGPPVALLNPTPPIQYIPYGRPFPYATNVYSTLPVTYPTSSGFFGAPFSLNPPVPPSKPADPQKLNVVHSFTGVPFQSYSNIFPNRTVIPYSNGPTQAAFTPFPAVASATLFPASGCNQPINPAFIQPPVNVYMAGNLPYHQKLSNVTAQVLPSRPPPGFSNTNQFSNTLDQDRLKRAGAGALQEQNSLLNSSSGVTRASSVSSQDTRSSSPDKNIQFLNNVHFPKDPQSQNASNWGSSVRANHDGKQEIEKNRPQLNSVHSFNSDSSFMGEKFVEEISKLLNDQSPIKSKPYSATFNDMPSAYSSNTCNSSVITNVQNVREEHTNSYHINSNDLGRDMMKKSSLSNSLFSRENGDNVSKTFLTLQQVESSLYSSSSINASSSSSSTLCDGLKTRQQFLENRNFAAVNNSLPTSFSNLPEKSNFSQQLHVISQESQIFSDSFKWSNSRTNSPSSHPFALSNLIRSNNSSTPGTSIPLYLRKGTSSNSNLHSNSESKSEALVTNYGSSSGWDIDTIKSNNFNNIASTNGTNTSNSSYNSSGVKEDFSNSLAAAMLRFEKTKSMESDFLNKTDPLLESKTYAGVLRSKKFDLDDSDQI
ncbi:UNVERIFIED_CONTAM: hypothetical protein RMT77_009867 [Armadillidium vulgare]